MGQLCEGSELLSAGTGWGLATGFADCLPSKGHDSRDKCWLESGDTYWLESGDEHKLEDCRLVSLDEGFSMTVFKLSKLSYSSVLLSIKASSSDLSAKSSLPPVQSSSSPTAARLEFLAMSSSSLVVASSWSEYKTAS